jgi:beta-galactosidase
MKLQHMIVGLVLAGVSAAPAGERIDFNGQWRFQVDLNESDFVPLGISSDPWKIISHLPSEPRWGAPWRMFDQCPVEGWDSGTDFKFPADIAIDLNGKPEIAGVRLHFNEAPPKTYELFVQDAVPSKPVPVAASASSEELRRGNAASNAIDGDPGTRWCAASGKDGEWLMLDFGRALIPGTLSIQWEKNAVYRYRIDGSTDQKSWICLSDQTQASSPRAHTEDSLQETVRYVRITVTGKPPGVWASIAEVGVARPLAFEGRPVAEGTFSSDPVQLITFPGQRAGCVNLRLLSGEFAHRCRIGELELLDADGVDKARALLSRTPGPKPDLAAALSPVYDDSAWRTLDLPHDWSIEQSFNAGNSSGRNSAYLPGGLGVYRKTFTVPDEWKNKKVTLKFGGIYMNSSVYCNGAFVGGRNYGYCTYVVDLTPHLKFGEENTVAVRVDNRQQPNSRWYTGSGIYRDVTLQVSDPVHIAQWGIFASFPSVTRQEASVRIQTRLLNETDRPDTAIVTQAVYAPDGTEVAAGRVEQALAAGGEATLDQALTVKNPQLWSPDRPDLYRLVTTVETAAGRTDRQETPLGIRTIEYGPDFGFRLNGEKLIMKGLCLHHDLGAVGAAEFPRALDRRLDELKKLGVNAIRTSHNPYSEYFMKRCDELGFLVIAEMYDKWNFGNEFYDPDGTRIPWNETWPRDLKEFVLRDRNHPSVIMWSVGNEVAEQVRDRNVDNTGPNDGGISVFQALRRCVLDADDTRPVSAGLFPRLEPGDQPPKMASAMDAVGTNYLENHWKNWRKNHPDMVFYASEMSTYNWGENWFAWDKDKGIGQFYWGGTDYLGEGRGWPNIGWYRGLIDLTGFIKDGACYVKSFYRPEPMVHLVVKDDQAGEESVVWNAVRLTKDERLSHWNWEGRKEVSLYVYTNCEEVELFLNDRSLGVRPVEAGDKNLLVWEVPFEPGVLKAVALKQGQTVAGHVLKTAGPPARIALSPERNVIGSDRDLGYINVSVVDEHGTVVPRASSRIRFEVTGAGENAAVSSADVLSSEPFRGDARSVFQGRAQLIVRSLKEGPITVRAFSDGLPAAETTITAEQNGASK